MPRGRRSKQKQKTTKIDIQVVLLIVISIILGILIYTKSGTIGENLTPFLRWFNRMGKIYPTTWNISNCNTYSN